MAYINFAGALKGSRAQSIVTALGTTFYLLLYSGTQPGNPDTTVPSGTLLGTLTNSGVASLSYIVVGATARATGTGGTTGTQTVTGTTGTGTKFTASVAIAGGAITAINSISLAGAYTVLPTNLDAEPVTGGGLTGATLSLQTTGVVSMGFTTANATANGTAGFVRIALATTAGGPGLIDEDVGTSASFSFQINTTAIALGGPIVVSSAIITEA